MQGHEAREHTSVRPAIAKVDSTTGQRTQDTAPPSACRYACGTCALGSQLPAWLLGANRMRRSLGQSPEVSRIGLHQAPINALPDNRAWILTCAWTVSASSSPHDFPSERSNAMALPLHSSVLFVVAIDFLTHVRIFAVSIFEVLGCIQRLK